MKYLYFWNDLPLFIDSEMSWVTTQLNAFLKSLPLPYHYQVFDNSSYQKWAIKLTKYCPSQCITIGTRPQKVNCLKTGINIRPQRKINLRNKQSNATLGESDIEKLLKLTNQEKIILIEDITNTGTTLSCVLSDIFKCIPDCDTTIHLLFANELAVKNLMQKWPTVNFIAEHYMQGKALDNTTIFCLYDLLFKNLAGKPYLEQHKIFKDFFSCYTEDFVSLLNNLKNYNIHEEVSDGS
jgi:hypoxanthine phosphoribosyltransferase